MSRGSRVSAPDAYFVAYSGRFGTASNSVHAPVTGHAIDAPNTMVITG
jgi:hypothetical protein